MRVLLAILMIASDTYEASKNWGHKLFWAVFHLKSTLFYSKFEKLAHFPQTLSSYVTGLYCSFHLIILYVSLTVHVVKANFANIPCRMKL